MCQKHSPGKEMLLQEPEYLLVNFECMQEGTGWVIPWDEKGCGDQSLLWLKDNDQQWQLLIIHLEKQPWSDIGEVCRRGWGFLNFPYLFHMKIFKHGSNYHFFIAKTWLWCSRMNIWNTLWWMSKGQVLMQWTKNARRKLGATRINREGWGWIKKLVVAEMKQ